MFAHLNNADSIEIASERQTIRKLLAAECRLQPYKMVMAHDFDDTELFDENFAQFANETQ